MFMILLADLLCLTPVLHTMYQFMLVYYNHLGSFTEIWFQILKAMVYVLINSFTDIFLFI